ncbi:MAG: class I SAM-dependent methyltransferase [Burkholderiales bacterium]
MHDVERQARHFEGIASRYLAARGGISHLEMKSLLWRDFFGTNLSLLNSPARVLEPMCGYAEGYSILSSYLPHKFSYVGFDYSPALVQEATRRAHGGQVFVQDITTFQSPERFDLIILIGGLHHVHKHTGNVLGRLYRALLPGGWFISFEPTQNNWITREIRARIYRHNALFDEKTERGYDLHEINAEYRSAGFEIVDQMYPGLLAYVLYYNPDAFPVLNQGGIKGVRGLYRLERPYYRSCLARWASFTTLSLLRKPAFTID